MCFLLLVSPIRTLKLRIFYVQSSKKQIMKLQLIALSSWPDSKSTNTNIYFLQLAHTAPNRPKQYKGLQDWRHTRFSTHFLRPNSCFKCVPKQTHPLRSSILFLHWSICITSGLLSLHLHLFLAYSLLHLHPLPIYFPSWPFILSSGTSVTSVLAPSETHSQMLTLGSSCPISQEAASALGRGWKSTTPGSFHRCPWTRMVRRFVPNQSHLCAKLFTFSGYMCVQCIHAEHRHTIKQTLAFYICFVMYVQFSVHAIKCHLLLIPGGAKKQCANQGQQCQKFVQRTLGLPHSRRL